MTHVLCMYRQVSLYAMDTFLKNVAQFEPKFPFKAVYFLGVRGLTASCYIVYGYTASGHTASRVYMYCVCIICRINISIQYIYLFLTQQNCYRLTSLIFGTVHSDRTLLDILYKHLKS